MIPIDLAGKVALVSGASQGLGRASAAALAQAGASVAIASRSAEKLNRAAAEIQRGSGRQVLALPADISLAGSIADLLERVNEQLGAPDILVVSGGGPPPGSFEALSDDDWQRALDLLLFSTIRLIRGVLPAMKAKGSGRIIVVLSSGVKTPLPNLILSNAVRGAVLGLLKTLAVEMAPHGVLVNGVVPGRIDTERVQQLDAAKAARQDLPLEAIRLASEQSIPLGRYGHPDEFARAVLYLASELASYTTGTLIEVDGGKTNTTW